jgi:hypothetical protein
MPSIADDQTPSAVHQPVRSKSGAIASFVLSILSFAGAAWEFYAFSSVDALDLRFWFALVLVFVGIGCIRVGRRLLMRSAYEALTDDKRPPVVYLRPFAEDEGLTHQLPVGERVGGRSLASNLQWKASHEQWLARALVAVGPVVAVGKPGDRLAPLGAPRFYLADDQWQQKVDALLRGSGAVVLRPETSAGTRWEVEQVSQLIDHRRVLLIVPNPCQRPLAFARIKSLVEKAWPLPSEPIDADAFFFDEQNNPQPLKLGSDAATTLGAFVEQIEKLQGSAAPNNRGRHTRWSYRLDKMLHPEAGTDHAPRGVPGEFPDIPFRIQNGLLFCAAGTKPLAELVWAYGEVYTEPPSKSSMGSMWPHYQIVLWNRNSVAFVLPVQTKFCQAALDVLRSAAPWLPVGYSLALKESWNKDRAELLALIDSYRAGGTAFDAPWAGSNVVEVKVEAETTWL